MLNKIAGKKNEFETVHAVRAGRLLVGTRTARGISDHCKDHLVLTDGPRGIRDYILGLPVYVMDEEDYLEVAP